ncbi:MULTISPECIES: hypothetical protein [Bacillaceae]|uniref:Uncharacterized protein n=1 Tax=Bacillus infantis NRRL B-14911 TaxID=1367477 RepID=U5LBV3_9BACI|nr:MULTISPECIES: hypothetical protein [Bacillus]OXT18345.1 hypothetical protein B9K06_07550 [Bacillus sp. OG2]AGX04893.1 hypothetical protein N288_14965 [Bacillus infantis NRRL B-14911]MCA1035293.1 hypothetical protein [Bacillus infantis]MCK6208719.1 hypothetical protein [Bacillus infantis]MCP1158974.1 hypothetical protein [Bacillus infantis]
MTGLVTVVMIFSIPLVAIVTSHYQSLAKTKVKIIEKELELEKLKHENYLIETQKMRIELEKMKLEGPLEVK